MICILSLSVFIVHFLWNDFRTASLYSGGRTSTEHAWGLATEEFPLSLGLNKFSAEVNIVICIVLFLQDCK